MFLKVNGPAGHGKTHELIKDIQALYVQGIPEYAQCFVVITPTNKAAMVLNSRFIQAGLPPLAKTLHSTLYSWVQTDNVKSIKQVRRIDPATLKFSVDAMGEPVYDEEIEFYFDKTIRETIQGKIVFVDESSMVNSEVWQDLIECGLITEIRAYGDERQLPPIESYDDLADGVRPYFRFWHNYKDEVKTLTVNHRQQGDLKEFVEVIESSIFKTGRGEIPVPMAVGENLSIHSSELTEQQLLSLMMESDVILTPYHKVRMLSNLIMRRERANRAGRRYVDRPVVGDKIIFTDAIKRDTEVNGRTVRTIYLPKNVCAEITNIHDFDANDSLMIIDFIDETGVEHKEIMVRVDKILGTKSYAECPRIDYAYAITVHASQGGQWDNVLFLDSFWKDENIRSLRYVAVTRAKKQLHVVTGITNSTESEDAKRSILIRLGQLVQK
jgi:exodeoxyribonuclease-5